MTEKTSLEAAVNDLEVLERCSDRPAAYPALVFLASGLVSFLSYFRLIDLMTWLGIDRFDVTAPAMVAFVLVFVVFLAVFVLLISVLERIGFVDIRSRLRKSLADLALNGDELRGLRDIVASRSWKHGSLYEDVIDGAVARRAGEADGR